MCIVCDQFNPFGVNGDWLHENDRENGLIVSETTDAAANTGTTYTMSDGDTFAGNLSFADDWDWVAIELTQGVEYTITMTAGTMSDTFLSVHYPSGTTAAANDDFGGSNDSQITFTPSFSGTYYIGASSYDAIYDTGDTDIGSYEVTVTSDGSPPLPGETARSTRSPGAMSRRR